MAILTVTQLGLTAVDPGFVPADVAGDEFTVDNRTIFTMRNDDVAATTIDFVSQLAAIPGYIPDNHQETVPAGGERVLIFDPSRPFADGNDRVQVTYSSVTSLSVAATRA